MEDFSQTNVRPIRFKALPEDGIDTLSCKQQTKFDNNDYQHQQQTLRYTNKSKYKVKNSFTLSSVGQEEDDDDDDENDATNKKKIELSNNFSFECTYPAIIFDEVCFSIDKSQQQANFLNELIHRLKNCLTPLSGLGEQSNKNKIEILKSINLTVPYGSIFGLLGPSSCGKTTLLRCLVGLLRPSSGFIQLFCKSLETHDNDVGRNEVGTCCFHCFCCSCRCHGHRKESLKKSKAIGRRSSDCQVPGANVGYMPQDLGLYEDFTIRQLLTMFGQYMKMGSKLIKTRIDFMAKFLDLPEVDREISSLSGGQKRRVSFAIACLHMPPLIILDEPTVGVDPLLRQSIWKYLRRLADEENKTIIITTHYIEEAAQADQVALMRAGEILVQDTPNNIMESHGCKTLEDAFLKICNNVKTSSAKVLDGVIQPKLYPQPKFNWHNQFESIDASVMIKATSQQHPDPTAVVRQLKLKKDQTTISKDNLINHIDRSTPLTTIPHQYAFEVGKNKEQENINDEVKGAKLLLELNDKQHRAKYCDNDDEHNFSGRVFNMNKIASSKQVYLDGKRVENQSVGGGGGCGDLRKKLTEILILTWALLYKNYRRNVNSLPLLAFQFMLPILQMISFSLCVGGRPTNIGLGIVNLDQPIRIAAISPPAATNSALLLTSIAPPNNVNISSSNSTLDDGGGLDYSDYELSPTSVEDLLSTRYLSFIDHTMLSVKIYDNLKDALEDVRKAKLWAAMEIGENFTTTLLRRFDLENFYQLDLSTIRQSVIKLYPDRSNKVLDMICHRSLVNSYRKFLSDQFEHFRRLPIEVKGPIYDIKPNLISNSIDGYTESIAAGLLASLTYIMAAGLTTFIMVVERSTGILERTFTSGINPVAYLLVHAIFRSFVMMAQIAVVMVLTFYILKQPLVGSIWLAYLMLMTLNLTGISYGLLVSSLVTDQNGAALTIVSSLVVKITLSGILWPFEAIPRWLRTICYIQPLTMPIQALKAITLKGSGLEDRVVYLGFFVSLTWLVIFITIASKRFKFYQH